MKPKLVVKGQQAKVTAGTHKALVISNSAITTKTGKTLGVYITFELQTKEGGLLKRRFPDNIAPGSELRKAAEAINGGNWDTEQDLDVLNRKACQVKVVVDNKAPGGRLGPRIEEVLKAK